MHRNSRLKKSNKMQQYADIYLLLNYSTCFGRPLRPSSGVHKTAVVASGTDHTLWGCGHEACSPVSMICTTGWKYSFMYTWWWARRRSERCTVIIIIIIITIIFLLGLGRLTCSGIDALPSFPGASTISSSSRFVVEGVFRESGRLGDRIPVGGVIFRNRPYCILLHLVGFLQTARALIFGLLRCSLALSR